MRNIDKIRKLKPKKLSIFFNHYYTEPCESCVYEKMCTAADNGNGTAFDCYEGCRIWLKQKYNKSDKCWECLKGE